MDFRLAKIELNLVDDEERFETLELHMEEPKNGMDEFCGELQGALNAAINKLVSEGETMRYGLVERLAAVKEESRFLREELD